MGVLMSEPNDRDSAAEHGWPSRGREAFCQVYSADNAGCAYFDKRVKKGGGDLRRQQLHLGGPV